MLRRLTLAAGAATLALSMSAAMTLAAPNPSGTGQPNAECGDDNALVEAPGFSTGGFENAEEHYAGEGDASINHAGSDHAVSQYDVACYQLSQR